MGSVKCVPKHHILSVELKTAAATRQWADATVLASVQVRIMKELNHFLSSIYLWHIS